MSARLFPLQTHRIRRLQIHNNGGVKIHFFDAEICEGKTGGTGKIHILESGFELRNVQSLDGAPGHAGNTLPPCC